LQAIIFSTKKNITFLRLHQEKNLWIIEMTKTFTITAISATSPTMRRLVSDILISPLCLLNRRLSKKLGVLNEDGVYS
jgi:hypothetical protein